MGEWSKGWGGRGGPRDGGVVHGMGEWSMGWGTWLWLLCEYNERGGAVSHQYDPGCISVGGVKDGLPIHRVQVVTTLTWKRTGQRSSGGPGVTDCSILGKGTPKIRGHHKY